MNENLKHFIERLDSIKDSIATEEATKTSMIMPFFQLLGYDVFNPLEFVPEYTADVGLKKKEKVDYAIIVDGKPLIFIECKAYTEDLNKHSSQLIRYFNTTPDARFAILTNGVIYKFYTDLENTNIMDKTPFLTIDLLDMNDRDINELKKFKKDALDVDTILSSAEDLKYTRLIKSWLEREMTDPSPSFVRLIISDMHSGVKNQKVVDYFTPLVKRAVSQYITDTLNTKIKNALGRNPDDAPVSEEPKEPEKEETHEKKIITTLDELEAFGIVKSILRKIVDSSRVTYRDNERYFTALLDDNNRKWICRFYLDRNKKHIVLSDQNKNGVRYDIESIDDIYNYADQIIESCQKYL